VKTMLYVHVAKAHAREWPEPVHEAARREMDPDKRSIAMLGARAASMSQVRGSHVAASSEDKTKAVVDTAA
jgi:hypothetical protein